MISDVAGILLVTPSSDFGSNRAGPPLGLLYLATVLHRAGHHVDVVDFSAESYDELVLARRLATADLVGVSVLSRTSESASRLVRAVRRHAPGVPIVAGGPHCTVTARPFEGADVTVTGEAERVIAALVDDLLQSVPGTRRSRRLVAGGCLSEEELERLDLPRRELVLRYVDSGYDLVDGQPAKSRSTSLLTTRGCPMSCRFCARTSLSFRRYRERSVASVLDEFEQVADAGYRVVDLVDDNPTANSKRFVAIMEGIVARGIRLAITLNGWAGAKHPALYDAMAEAGVRIIAFGLESGCQEVLDYYGKGLSLHQCRDAVQRADAAGLYTAGSFIFGAPMETDEHLERTTAFAMSLPLDFANIRALEYTRGSSLGEELYAAGRVPSSEPRVLADRRLGLSPFTSKELEARCARAQRLVEEDPARLARLSEKLDRLGRPYEPRTPGDDAKASPRESGTGVGY